jgi:hypothetical protein
MATKYPQNEKHLERFPERRIQGRLKKTEQTVMGGSGNDGFIKRTLYEDEKGDLYAKYFGNWWKFPEDIEH